MFGNYIFVVLKFDIHGLIMRNRPETHSENSIQNRKILGKIHKNAEKSMILEWIIQK